MTKVGYVWALVEKEVVRHGLYPIIPLFLQHAKARDITAVSVTSGFGGVEVPEIVKDLGTIWLNNQDIGASYNRRWVFEVPVLNIRTRMLASNLESQFLVKVDYVALNGRASTASRYITPFVDFIPEAEVIE